MKKYKVKVTDLPKFKVVEEDLKERRKLTFVYHAKSFKHAITMVANRHGSPHYTKAELVFNRFGDSASSQACHYTADRIWEE